MSSNALKSGQRLRVPRTQPVNHLAGWDDGVMQDQSAMLEVDGQPYAYARADDPAEQDAD